MVITIFLFSHIFLQLSKHIMDFAYCVLKFCYYYRCYFHSHLATLCSGFNLNKTFKVISFKCRALLFQRPKTIAALCGLRFADISLATSVFSSLSL